MVKPDVPDVNSILFFSTTLSCRANSKKEKEDGPNTTKEKVNIFLRTPEPLTKLDMVQELQKEKRCTLKQCIVVTEQNIENRKECTEREEKDHENIPVLSQQSKNHQLHVIIK